MLVPFASNMLALRLARNLNTTSNQVGVSAQRLSSGSRITKSGDDPAGASLAKSLQNDSRLMITAIRNANDALSVTNIADAGLAEISSIISRMSELALQSSNGSYTNVQRSSLQLEFAALGSEIDRISQTVTFNDLPLLSNSSAFTAQIGIDGNAQSRITIDSVLATTSFLALGSGSSLTYSLSGATTLDAVSASRLAYSALDTAADSVNLQQGVIGAVSGRLSSAIDFLSVARENILAAEAQINDVNLAEEFANFTKLSVLQNVQVSLSAQANQQPALVASLLKDVGKLV
jgi:flagellin